MDNQLVYFKENVVKEPVINGWAAHSHMIPPATYSMVLKNSYIKIMESYLNDAKAHLTALKIPKLSGGPWLNCPEERKDEVAKLLASTKKAQAPLLELANAIETLDEILKTQANGFSMEPLYAKVPEALRGCVELTYDLNNQPRMRFIEGLLYQSSFFDNSLHGFALSLISKDLRSFRRSTPILESDDVIIVQMPFGGASMAELFESSSKPSTIGALIEKFQIRKDQKDIFKSLLTTEAPASSGGNYRGDDVRIRYFGHATVLVQTNDVSVLTDPFVSYRYPTSLKRYTYEDLPDKIDFALISHTHVDHLDFETLFRLQKKIECLVVPKTGGGKLEDPSLKLLLNKIGFKNVLELNEMESVDFSGGQISAVPFLGEHGDLDIRTKSGYMVLAKGKKIMFVADSRNVEPEMYVHIHRHFGNIDVLFVAMEAEGAPFSWSYGHLLANPIDRKMDRSRAISGGDASQALEMVNILKPRQALVYGMGREPWLFHVLGVNEDPKSRRISEPITFTSKCKEKGVSAEELVNIKEIFLQAN